MAEGGPRTITGDTLQRFALSVFDAVSQVFASTPHIEGIRVLSDEQMATEVGAHAGAAYSAESGGVLLWRDSSRKVFAGFLTGQYLDLPEAYQIRVLREVKIELLMLVHEAIHAQGPANREEFEHDYINGILDEGIRAFKEGITEAAAEATVNEVIQKLGLDKYDKRLLDLPTPDIGAYPGQTIAMVQVIAGVARDQHRSGRDELNDIVRDGCGNVALDRMIRRYVSSSGGTPDVPIIAVIQRAARSMLAECAAEFSEVLEAGDVYGARQMAYLDQVTRDRAAQRGNAILKGLREVTARAIQRTPPHLMVCRPDISLE